MIDNQTERIDSGEPIKRTHVFLIFLVLIGIHLMFLFNINVNIVTEDVLFYHFQDQVTAERLEKMIENKNDWLGYAVLPVIFLLKVFSVAVCILIGYFVLNFPIRFATVFRVAVIAEFVFLLPPAFMQFWFQVVTTHYTLADIWDFAPFSLLAVVNSDELDNWMKYLLKNVNLFEVLYISILSYKLSADTGKNFLESFKVVFLSYGTGLFLWMTFVVFMIVTMS